MVWMRVRTSSRDLAKPSFLALLNRVVGGGRQCFLFFEAVVSERIVPVEVWKGNGFRVPLRKRNGTTGGLLANSSSKESGSARERGEQVRAVFLLTQLTRRRGRDIPTRAGRQQKMLTDRPFWSRWLPAGLYGVREQNVE